MYTPGILRGIINLQLAEPGVHMCDWALIVEWNAPQSLCIVDNLQMLSQ